MSKRQHGQHELRPRDFYTTPFKAVLPLIPHLEPGCRFYEPCAGSSDLVDHLVAHGMICAGASDIEPQREGIVRRDALNLTAGDLNDADVFITNPPYSKSSRPLTLALLYRLSALRPTWLLLPADFAHNAYAGPVLAGCDRIVSIGRVRWIAGSTTDGYENSAWMRFDARHSSGPRFYPRMERLRERLATFEDLADIAHHDVDRVYEASEKFLRELLQLLDEGRIAEVTAKIRWHLGQV